MRGRQVGPTRAAGGTHYISTIERPRLPQEIVARAVNISCIPVRVSVQKGKKPASLAASPK